MQLRPRTEATVRAYYHATQDESIRRMLPSGAASEADALRMFHEAEGPASSSFGRTVWLEDAYIGDVWCYGIDPHGQPNAMLSFCIFDRAYWRQGHATWAVRQFLTLAQERYGLTSIGAFAYADNAASLRVMEKNGFSLRERFTEDGRESVYLEKCF